MGGNPEYLTPLPPPTQGASAGPVVLCDLRSLSQAQICTLAAQHNTAQGVGEPVKEVLDGIKERSGLRDPKDAVIPLSLGGGGGPEWSRAWRQVVGSLGRTQPPPPAQQQQQQEQSPADKVGKAGAEMLLTWA